MAVIKQEPGAQHLAERIAAEPAPKISAATFVELCAVADSRVAVAGRRAVDEYLREMRIEVVDFTAEHARIARDAYRDYGKGSGSRARLNLDDCFSYALAMAMGEPLLFVGDDFTHTDVRPALPAS